MDNTLTTLIVVGAIGFSLILVNSILLGNIFFTQRKASAARNWPSAAGTVVESRLDQLSACSVYLQRGRTALC